MRGKCNNSESVQTRRKKRAAEDELEYPRRIARTTPAWGITDGIASQEIIDDGNNDSGVSPDHYTSNSVSPTSGLSSGRSSSLSPRSTNSQDSNSTQSTPYSYTPRGVMNNSPLQFLQRNSTEEPRQTMNIPPAIPGTSRGTQDSQEILQCPICVFSTENRLVFTEHLVTHCATKSNAQKFVKTIFEQVAPLGEDMHFEDMNEPGMIIPRVNSQGKVKTFKCKQCTHVAVTKLEFWNHSRTHIKGDKVLTCSKCPFVTEYKHHLEYHIRNHFGSKPFQCDKCEYTCVNKSMLNSHKKSHSKIYQYGCADCSYATKYCHSLKLHLRKYVHQPAMVLNPDGSPNPLPIIDVYGTRRGPKQRTPRRSNNDLNRQRLPSNNYRSSLSPPQSVTSPSLSPINPMNIFNGTGSPTQNGFTGSNSLDAIIGQPNTFSPVSSLTNAFTQASTSSNYPQPGPSNAYQPITGPASAYQPIAGPSTAYQPIAGPSNAFQPIAGSSSAYQPVAGPSNAYQPIPGTSNAFNVVLQNQPMMILPYSQLLAMAQLASAQSFVDGMQRNQRNRTSSAGFAANVDNDADVQEFPQDLVVRSRSVPTDVPQPSTTLPAPRFLEQEQELPLDLSKMSTYTSTPKKPAARSTKGKGTSRRKGKAVKLDRRVCQKDTDDEQQQLEDLRFQEFQRQMQQIQQQRKRHQAQPQQHEMQPEQTQQQEPCTSPPVANSSDTGEENNDECTPSGLEFHCPFCEIVFSDLVMFSVHMGYHGFEDPYTCNMCGEACDNKLNFFMHVVKSNHS